jgi:hypothetical protein
MEKNHIEPYKMAKSKFRDKPYKPERREYIGRQWCGTMISGNQEEAK